MTANLCPTCGRPLRNKMGITIDEERRTVMREGKAVRLSAKQFAMFMTLYERRGRLVSDAFLKEQVWGDDLPLYQTFHAMLSTVRTYLIPLGLRIECETQAGHELVIARRGRRFASTRRR